MLVDYEGHQMTVYVEKENGTYGPTNTGSYLVKNYIDDFWKNRNYIIKDALKQLLNNEISPVGFYMLILNMAPAEVASRVGIGTSQVKKHMKPDHFGKVTVGLAQKYADIFGIPVANIFQVSTETGIINQNSIQQEKTKNPFIVTVK